jgi:hypothetical protein
MGVPQPQHATNPPAGRPWEGSGFHFEAPDVIPMERPR